jgi:hypothetical protein
MAASFVRGANPGTHRVPARYDLAIRLAVRVLGSVISRSAGYWLDWLSGHSAWGETDDRPSQALARYRCSLPNILAYPDVDGVAGPAEMESSVRPIRGLLGYRRRVFDYRAGQG